MIIALDISPLERGHFLQHRVRGTGMYINSLKESFTKYFPQNSYTFFTKRSEIPNDCDVVHILYFEPFFLTLPFFNKYRTVVTVHDFTPFVFPKYFPSGIKGKIKWMIQKSLLQKAHGIIADSLASKKDIIKFANIPEEKVHVVYLAAGKEFGIVEEKEKVKIKKKYDLPDEFVLYVGDVTWNKNLPRLVDAIAMTDIPIVMVGKALTDDKVDIQNPWNRDLLVVRKKIKNNTQFILLGFVPTEDLVALYNLATVFVMPSIYEGFGLPILEAMQCGCPVITTKGGSIPEVGGQAVFYADPYETDSIASGITKVISDKSLQEKLSESGMKQAAKFSWEKTVAQTMGIYESI